jgi:hypothetical protein
MTAAAAAIMITAPTPIRRAVPDKPLAYPGMEAVEPREDGPDVDEPTFVWIDVVCDTEPLVSVTVTV